MPECVSTLWNSIDEVLCAIKIEKLQRYVGLQVEIMEKKKACENKIKIILKRNKNKVVVVNMKIKL
jgi:hypothetical protein